MAQVMSGAALVADVRALVASDWSAQRLADLAGDAHGRYPVTVERLRRAADTLEAVTVGKLDGASLSSSSAGEAAGLMEKFAAAESSLMAAGYLARASAAIDAELPFWLASFVQHRAAVKGDGPSVLRQRGTP